MSFWKSLLTSAAQSAAQTTSVALSNGADWKTTGTAAGAGALVGLLQSLLSHPATAHETVTTAVASLPSTPVAPPAASAAPATV